MAKRHDRAWVPWLLLAFVLAAGWMAWPRPPALPVLHGNGVLPALPAGTAADPLPPVEAPRTRPGARSQAQLPAFLPREARDTIATILRGGPFPHRQDGGVFGNREARLPRSPRGWYREYTVETPGVRHRGARRIVTGGEPPRDWYYTDDHYESFRRFQVAGAVP